MQAKIPYLLYGMVDESTTRATMRLTIKPSTTLSTAQTICSSTRSLIENMTDCAIDRQSVVFPFLADAPGIPATGANNHKTGIFIFATTDIAQLAVLELPGITEACILTTGPTAGIGIDVLNTDVAAFIDAMVNGLYMNMFGYDITELLAAFVEIRD